jgi:hypothetical protein
MKKIIPDETAADVEIPRFEIIKIFKNKFPSTTISESLVNEIASVILSNTSLFMRDIL